MPTAMALTRVLDEGLVVEMLKSVWKDGKVKTPPVEFPVSLFIPLSEVFDVMMFLPITPES